MRKLIILSLAVVLIFASCVPSPDLGNTDIFLFSVGVATNGLSGTGNDVSGFSSQIEYLAEQAGNGFHYYEVLQADTDSRDLIYSGPGESGRAIDPSEVVTLIKEDLLGGNDIGKDDLVIFYYTGHGTEDGRFVFDPTAQDGGPDDPVLTPMADVVNAFADNPGRTLLVIDCCYSGQTILNESGMSNGQNFSMTDLLTADGALLEQTRLESESFLTAVGEAFALSAGSGTVGNNDIWVMSASHSMQLSAGGFYSTFTQALIKALGFVIEQEGVVGENGLPDTNTITFYGLYNKVKDAFREEGVYNTMTTEPTLNAQDLILFSL